MVRFVRANLAQAKEEVPPVADPDYLDSGGAEPGAGTTSEQGYIGVVEEELSIRERVVGR
jgi:hypothetical protein